MKNKEDKKELTIAIYYRQVIDALSGVIRNLRKFCCGHPIAALSVLMLGTSVFVFFPYLFQKELYIYSDIGSDTRNVYYPFFVSLARKIEQGDFSLWDFTYGTGVNILSRQADVGNIFTWLTCLGGTRGIKYALVFVHILKILLSGYVCYFYLNNFKFSTVSKVTVAYIYAFNGFMMLWGQHYFFGNASLYIVLLLFAIEKALKCKKGYVYTVLSTSIILCTSYYLGYMILLFAAVYVIFRLMHMYTWQEKNKAFAKIGGLLTSVIIGACLSAFIFLPAAALVLNTSARFGSDMSLFEKVIYHVSHPYDKFTYLGMFSRLFSNNLMGTNDYVGALNYYEMPQFFFTCFNVFIGVIFVSELFFDRKEKRKITLLKGIETVLILFVMFNPLPSVIFNGFVTTFFRYTYILMPIFGLCYADVFDKLIRGNLTHKKFEISLACLVSLVILTGVAFKTNTASRTALFSTYIYLLMIVVFALLALYIQDVKASSMKRIICIGSVVMLVAANVNFESFVTTNERTTTSSVNPSVYLTSGNDDVKEALSYISEIDDSFYRVEKTFEDVAYLNDSLLQGYYGISTYNSVLNKNIIQFVKELCPDFDAQLVSGYNQFTRIYKDVDTVSLLGVKYILTKDYIDDVPEYVYLKTVGSVHIYQNVATEGIAKFYSDAIDYNEYKKLDEADTDGLINDTLIIHNLGEDAHGEERVEKSEAVMDKPTIDSCVNGTVDAKQDGWVFAAIPYEEGWTAYVDGKKTEILQADIGYSAIRVEKGKHQIVFKYNTPLLKEGIIISCVGIICFALWCMLLYKGATKKRGSKQ